LKHEEPLVFPDGKLHPIFKYTSTDTSRLSAKRPSVQNFPNRKGKSIRRIIKAPAGHIIISADYGAQEFGTIGMVTQDQVIIQSIWNKYDVHLEWAKIIDKHAPKLYKQCLKETKDEKKAWDLLRYLAKNKLVFPSLFGASYRSMARNLEIDPDVMEKIWKEFKKKFPRSFDCQKELVDFYRKNGYVSTLAGHRCYYPMSKNKIINHPVQGSAAAMTNSAMYRLFRIAIDTGEFYLAPILQIHDDLTFIVPEDKKDFSVKTIVKEMCSYSFPWMGVVPILVELKWGYNWSELKPLGNFRSDSL
jgi:DNA polymerase-1